MTNPSKLYIIIFASVRSRELFEERLGGMEMDYITVSEAAKKWGVSTRRVQILCNQNRIKGAVRFGPVWKIPRAAVLPNARKKNQVPDLPMPRKSPYLDMTDLYNKVGGAEECAEMLVNQPEAHALFEAQIAYRRGEIAKVYKNARYFLDAHSGFYAILGAGMLLANCAIWSGDASIWYEAKRHICEAPSETEQEREIISLTLAVIDSSIYNNNDFPLWFTLGNFEVLPPDAHPVAKVFYVKYIYMAAFAIASGQYSIDGVKGLALMKLIPHAIEPMVTQATVDGTIIPEIYLRLSCAVAYHNSGDNERAISHIDKALALALPDRLYGTLAEYSRHLDGLLEKRLAILDSSATERVGELSAVYARSWSRLAGEIRKQNIATNLTQKEHEIAKLTAFGFSIKEIAAMLEVSESTVKHTITRIINKTGIQDKREFSIII